VLLCVLIQPVLCHITVNDDDDHDDDDDDDDDVQLQKHEYDCRLNDLRRQS